jgi:hypothetical protein
MNVFFSDRNKVLFLFLKMDKSISDDEEITIEMPRQWPNP